MGGLRFTASGLSSRAAVNLNPRHAGILKLAAAARITAMPGDGVGGWGLGW